MGAVGLRGRSGCRTPSASNRSGWQRGRVAVGRVGKGPRAAIVRLIKMDLRVTDWVLWIVRWHIFGRLSGRVMGRPVRRNEPRLRGATHRIQARQELMFEILEFQPQEAVSAEDNAGAAADLSVDPGGFDTPRRSCFEAQICDGCAQMPDPGRGFLRALEENEPRQRIG